MTRFRVRIEFRSSTAGFTLIELLVVVAVMAGLMALAVPAFNAISGNGTFTGELYNIAGTLEQARAYAMANNTYVLAGIEEVSASQDSAANPQVAGSGRIAIAVIASITGTRPYNVTSASYLGNIGWKSKYYNTGTVTFGTNLAPNGGFYPVTKLLQCPNLHLVDLQSGSLEPPASGNMARPAVLAANDLANPNCINAGSQGTEFAWPLGVKITGNPQYAFTKVLEFDPQGSARMINTTTLDAIPYCIEMGLQPSNGSAAPAAPAVETSGQIAAIQIDGMSGAVRTYRP
jgi:prepilin-type N-terminal cleavage/methylation domain-containing protein